MVAEMRVGEAGHDCRRGLPLVSAHVQTRRWVLASPADWLTIHPALLQAKSPGRAASIRGNPIDGFSHNARSPSPMSGDSRDSLLTTLSTTGLGGAGALSLVVGAMMIFSLQTLVRAAHVPSPAHASKRLSRRSLSSERPVGTKQAVRFVRGSYTHILRPRVQPLAYARGGSASLQRRVDLREGVCEV
jgi:hypothetical protein